jgi:hypothetical protein
MGIHAVRALSFVLVAAAVLGAGEGSYVSGLQAENSGQGITPTSLTATVSLSAAAPSGGVVVTLSSDKPTVIRVPASVTVPAGATGATFAIEPPPTLREPTGARITAAGGGQVQTLDVMFKSGTDVSTFAAMSEVVGGDRLSVTVEVANVAPPGGADVLIDATGDLGNVVHPPRITISEGQSRLTFDLETRATAELVSARILAADAYAANPWQPGAFRSSSVAIRPPRPTLLIRTLGGTWGPSAELVGGCPLLARLSIDRVVPAPIRYSLNTSFVSASTNEPVIGAGETSVEFSLTAFAVPAAQSGYVQAVTYPSGPLDQATASVSIVPPDFASLVAFAFSPAEVAGTVGTTGTASLRTVVATGGAVVAVSSSASTVVVPPTVTVAAGSRVATIPVATQAVTSDQSVTVTAYYGNACPTATLTVAALPVPASVAVLPASLTGGTGATGTVTLTIPAGGDGLVVNLAGSSTAVMLPAAVTVPAGATSASFAVRTSAVRASTPATITASASGVSKSATLAVVPQSSTTVVVGTVAVLPTAVTVGSSASGTITLAAPAPEGGLVVRLASSSIAAVVPASITIAAGETTGRFPVTTSVTLLRSTTATITATFGTATRSCTLTVNPRG